ncbi:hypothetical protein HII31_07164 [Pseudocercospora fuligena]|uniref:Uncharacterized protein n=1 Tax=Pseudocercospora fuligena TaxID=685502 RepID=A0A8H6RJC8_9PEZI|nr:hypothetical protein HII31_07164 [Pseudocercospora fuligena]
MSLTSPDHQLQDDEMSDLATALSHSASLQPYVESAPNYPPLTPFTSTLPEPGPSSASLEKSATYRLRFIAEMSAMTNFKRARKRIEEMGENEAFKLIRNSSLQQRLAAKRELAAKARREMEERSQQAEKGVQKRTKNPRPRASGPMSNSVVEPMSRREIIALRRRRYFERHPARLAEGFATPCVATAAMAGRASGLMSGPMSAPMSVGVETRQESAVQQPLPSCPTRPVKDFNGPHVPTGPMSAQILVERSSKISAADDEMEMDMADLTKSMHWTSL